MVIVESIIGTIMVKQMKSFLGSFGLINKVIAFLKDKITNLGIMTTIFFLNLFFKALLNLPTPFFGTC